MLLRETPDSFIPGLLHCARDQRQQVEQYAPDSFWPVQMSADLCELLQCLSGGLWVWQAVNWNKMVCQLHVKCNGIHVPFFSERKSTAGYASLQGIVGGGDTLFSKEHKRRDPVSCVKLRILGNYFPGLAQNGYKFPKGQLEKPLSSQHENSNL